MGRTEYTHVLVACDDDALAAEIDRTLTSCVVDRVASAADARSATKTARFGAWIIVDRDGDALTQLRW